MTSERWRQIELLYHAALERGPQSRRKPQYLAEACGGDDIRRIADAHGSGELAPGREEIIVWQHAPIGNRRAG